MTISVSYESYLGTTSLSDYLTDWAIGFATAGHGTGNTGGFSNGTFSGDQYSTHGANNSDYAFIADSNTSNGLHYVFNPALPASSNLNHYLWGNLDNVELGTGLTGGAGSDFDLSAYKVAFNGLDLFAAEGAGRTGNEVQSVIYGLMQGNTSALETVLNDLLDDFGLSTASTFDEVSAGLAAHAATAATTDVALVGVQDAAQDWALAA
ncbi:MULTISPECIES: heme acquisition protein HasA [Pseudomonas]|uniref:heme acquisition protein HasA n=1 Tax=Pseudomonas TaxID=286 RepID=UPI000811F6C7|nr:MULTISPECIES: heme acquisition protein HasA [unclassified Pseudomonas]MBW8130156.1 heme acquisition protein HasA [Pseudomonas sp. LAP_36]MBW8139095.1 heme acquisition protein HasA [Pseudomonas sp. PAMC 26818]CRM12109.1 Heme acquisition system protein A [Pseudomonas sp. 24 E 1]CRM22367.1 Heme acquisition system protein A [Pseudomonas sp. 58 R 12]CRM64515.1 Heme acquisition system protein A [Pseudomonas sp. 52 E 6]